MEQNDALEEQRTRMLRALRVHAENMGEKSVKAYGLNAEQMLKVNEFIENLKDVSGSARAVTLWACVLSLAAGRACRTRISCR